jgi:hypothetical protein
MSESEWIEVSTKSTKLQKRQESKNETKTKKNHDRQSIIYFKFICEHLSNNTSFLTFFYEDQAFQKKLEKMRSLNLKAYDPHSIQKENSHYNETYEDEGTSDTQEATERDRPTNSKTKISNDTNNIQFKRTKEEKKQVLNLISNIFD